MDWNKWVRQTHRWLSIVFTMTVVANFAAMALGKPAMWLVYSPLPPLFLMLFTGLYMFVLSYAAKCAHAKPRQRPAALYDCTRKVSTSDQSYNSPRRSLSRYR
jgi:hypothetical protein